MANSIRFSGPEASPFLHSPWVSSPHHSVRDLIVLPTLNRQNQPLRFQMPTNPSEGTGVPSVCLWSGSRNGIMGKGSHRRGFTPADR